MSDDADVLARTIYGEARGESKEGKIGVANVILNRANIAGWYGHTISEVCLKPMQFSCWNRDDPNSQKIKRVTKNDPSFASCIQVANDCIDGLNEDNTDGATHYQVIGTNAKWSIGKTPCAVIGHHEFFNDIQ